MNRVFSSEWLKIARPANLIGWMGPVVIFAFMGTMFNFMNAATDAGQFRGPFGIAPGPEQLAAPAGWIIGIYSASSFIGLIALAIFATNIARDYEYWYKTSGYGTRCTGIGRHVYYRVPNGAYVFFSLWRGLYCHCYLDFRST